MNRITTVSIGFMIVGGMLASNAALARKGGLPQCEEELLFCLETAQAFPATGQTSCWDSTGALIDCDGTGHDGEIRAGAPLDYTDTGLTIIDNNTKLEWMKQDDNNLLDPLTCDSLPGSLDADCFFSWDEAFAFVARLNDAEFAGHTDWRVPNVKELQSIVNYENLPPAVSAEFDTRCVSGCTVEACSCTRAASYWSSTSDADGPPTEAWRVAFGSGFVLTSGKTTAIRVRAVRGGL